jgi:hypothetical protein
VERSIFGGWTNMRTRKSTATFEHPFRLNAAAGELPGGRYEIEIDEEEIHASERTAYRRVAIYFYVRDPASTRTIIVDPADLEAALERDRTPRPGPAGARPD